MVVVQTLGRGARIRRGPPSREAGPWADGIRARVLEEASPGQVFPLARDGSDPGFPPAAGSALWRREPKDIPVERFGGATAWSGIGRDDVRRTGRLTSAVGFASHP